MLYMAGGGRITRVHGPFVSDREVEDVVAFLREQGEPAYIDDVTEVSDEDGGASSAMGGGEGAGEGSLYEQAVALVAREGKASTSFIQRHLQIGYNRAAKLIEQMEKDHVVGPANHVGKREVLVAGGQGRINRQDNLAPAVIVHGREHLAAALAPGLPVTLLSPPGLRSMPDAAGGR